MANNLYIAQQHSMESENKSPQAKINREKSWVARQKEESWEAELLVSALAVFGSFLT